MDPDGIVMIGCGQMGGAILRGALVSDDFPISIWVIVEPDEGRRAELRSLGVRVEASIGGIAGDLSGEGGMVLLAVKPQMLGAVEADVRGFGYGGVVVSMLAGTRSDRVRAAFGGGARVVRVMPSLPVKIGMGLTAVSIGAGARAGDERRVIELFSRVGEVIEIDEHMLDAFTGVVGSGPAYLYYLAEGMERGAERVGFEPEVARRLVRSTIAGAVGLLTKSGESPAALRAAVTSRRGTTEAAVGELDRAGVMAAMEQAIIAARDRGRSIAAG